MSLVVACNCGDCQYWCSDRVLVKWTGKTFKIVSQDYLKIRPFQQRAVLIGLSGSAYDADLLWKALCNVRGLHSLHDLIDAVQTAVLRINECSTTFAIENGLPIYETGILIGGYWGGTRFLNVVTPKGDVVRMSTIAAIGFGAERVRPMNLEALPSPPCWSDVSSLLDRYFRLYMQFSCHSVGLIDRFLVRSTGIEDVNETMANNAMQADSRTLRR